MVVRGIVRVVSNIFLTLFGMLMVMVVLRVRVKVVVRIVGDDDGMINFKLFGFLLRSNFRVSILSIQIIRIIAPTLLKISA